MALRISSFLFPSHPRYHLPSIPPLHSYSHPPPEKASATRLVSSPRTVRRHHDLPSPHSARSSPGTSSICTPNTLQSLPHPHSHHHSKKRIDNSPVRSHWIIGTFSSSISNDTLHFWLTDYRSWFLASDSDSQVKKVHYGSP